MLLKKTNVAKCLGLFIDNSLWWKYHVKCIVKLICLKIGFLKKVSLNLPNYVLSSHYNIFIRSGFLYCLMYWFKNDHSGSLGIN